MRAAWRLRTSRGEQGAGASQGPVCNSSDMAIRFISVRQAWPLKPLQAAQVRFHNKPSPTRGVDRLSPEAATAVPSAAWEHASDRPRGQALVGEGRGPAKVLRRGGTLPARLRG
jgi:hypothetical protein